MPGTQELTRRIKSVKSTRKVTRAMQMVSASKMRKSQLAALASRGYAAQAERLLTALHYSNEQELDQAGASDPFHASLALLRARPQSPRVAVVVISTNRGLVGSFNANLISQVLAVEAQYGADGVEYYAVGQKAMDALARLRRNVVAHFVKSDAPTMGADVYPLAHLLEQGFQKGTYRAVLLVYNKFISTLTQQVVHEQLLPLSVEGKVQADEGIFLYEPDPQTVLSRLLPKVFESRLYQALLENDAAEHSARMLMMKNATDSAGDIIADLTLTYNQLRQNKITTELSEITAGKIALENS